MIAEPLAQPEQRARRCRPRGASRARPSDRAAGRACWSPCSIVRLKCFLLGKQAEHHAYSSEIARRRTLLVRASVADARNAESARNDLVRRLGAYNSRGACSSGRHVLAARPRCTSHARLACSQTLTPASAGPGPGAVRTAAGARLRRQRPTSRWQARPGRREGAGAARGRRSARQGRRPRSTNGNKNLAEQLFSTAELLVGPEALASIAPLFREGAPPRVTTPTREDRHPRARRSPRSSAAPRPRTTPAKVPPPQVEGSLDRHDADRRQAARRARSASSRSSRRAASGSRARRSTVVARAARPRVPAAPDGDLGRLDGVVPELRHRVPQRVLDVAARARSTSGSTRPARRASTRSRRKASSGSAATCTRT